MYSVHPFSGRSSPPIPYKDTKINNIIELSKINKGNFYSPYNTLCISQIL
jgi:hypothetical protein